MSNRFFLWCAIDSRDVSYYAPFGRKTSIKQTIESRRRASECFHFFIATDFLGCSSLSYFARVAKQWGEIKSNVSQKDTLNATQARTEARRWCNSSIWVISLSSSFSFSYFFPSKQLFLRWTLRDLKGPPVKSLLWKRLQSASTCVDFPTAAQRTNETHPLWSNVACVCTYAGRTAHNFKLCNSNLEDPSAILLPFIRPSNERRKSFSSIFLLWRFHECWWMRAKWRRILSKRSSFLKQSRHEC